MNRIIIVLVISFILLGCENNTQSSSDKIHKPLVKSNVIYGSDDRKDLYQVEDANLLALASSTVALMRSETIEVLNNDEVRILGSNFGSRYNLCESEPYRQQDSAAFCSGFLVAPNKIVTAGHCISDSNCNKTKFVFGFAVKEDGKLPSVLPRDYVYACKKVVRTESFADYGADFAVVELDREVNNFSPLALRGDGQIQKGDSVLVIGHPSGLPTKVSGGAQVRDPSPVAYFVANLDTYGGNSGSAVFNSETGAVEGILVRGETDYITKEGANCRVSNVCKDDQCMGEHVTKIEFAKPYL
ncbi:MAG: serine protease [Pseudomonadota bacterium]|nr:serine protease [Pseudomonadota bacterium]